MEPENTEEIVEETPFEEVVEDTPVEETPVEEAPIDEPTEEEPVVPFFTKTRTISGTEAQLEVMATYYGYPTEVVRPDVTPDMPIEERFIPNQESKLDYVTRLFDEMVTDFLAKPFIEARKQAKQAEINAEAEAVKALARQSIT